MLLSIDKVLQLLSEGKDIEKIASLSGVKTSDVVAVIDDARTLLHKHEKEKSKKKIVIRKKSSSSDDSARINVNETHDSEKPPFLEGIELTAVPLEDAMIAHIAAVEKDDYCGISLIICDSSERQLGKTGWCLRRISARKGLVRAALRVIEIAKYFRSRSIKIRVNDDIFVKQISGDISISDADTKKLFTDFNVESLNAGLPVKFETVNELQNEKAVYIAQKAIPSRN
jgi:hypothetical protein